MGIDDGGVRSLFVKAECLSEMLCHISPACYVYLYLVCIVHSEKNILEISGQPFHSHGSPEVDFDARVDCSAIGDKHVDAERSAV